MARTLEMLPNKKCKGHGWEPPLQLILAAWWDSLEVGSLFYLVRLRIGQYRPLWKRIISLNFSEIEFNLINYSN
jgi:hypothetical protein